MDVTAANTTEANTTEDAGIAGVASPAGAAARPGEMSQRQLWIILIALMLGTALAAIDGTIVSTALPTIAGKLHGFSSYAWVGTAYILTSTIATPILGKLGDLYGRRRIILSAIVVFLAGSLLCGLAHNMTELIVARGVQGLGGGGIQALTFAILGDLVSPRERGRYMGLYTGIFAAAAVVGPLVGGWMIDNFAWQWIFLFNVPIAAVAFSAIYSVLRVPFTRRHARVDFLGAALLSATLSALILGLDRGKHGWFRTPVMGLFVVAALAMVGFLVRETRAPEPLIPLRLFKNRVVATACAMGFLVGTLAYGAQQFLPLQFQDADFVSPTRAGLYLSPIMVGVMFGSAYFGRLISKTGRYKIFPIIGLGLSLAGVAALSRITANTLFLVFVIPMVAIGVGSGTTFTTSSIASQNAIDPADIGVATATLTALRTLGGSLGLALYGTVFNAAVGASLAQEIPAGSLPPGVAVTTLLREPAKIKALAPIVRDGVVRSITAGTARVFLVAVPIGIVAVALAVMLPELPLRTTRAMATAHPLE